MPRTTFKVPKPLEHWRKEKLEELIKEIIEKIDLPEAVEKRLSFDTNVESEIEKFAKKVNVNKGTLVYILLLLNSLEKAENVAMELEDTVTNKERIVYNGTYTPTGVTLNVTNDVNFYLLNLKKLKHRLIELDLIKKAINGTLTWDDVFTSHESEVVEKIKDTGVVFLDSDSLNELYKKKFRSYEDFVLAFLFVFNRDKNKPAPIDVGELSILSFELYLPESVFKPDVPVKDFLKLKEEDGSTQLYVGSVEQQITIQDVAGKLMDTYYVSEDTTKIRVPDWMYESPWSFKVTALKQKFLVNPYWVGRAHRVAPVEIFLTADKLYGVDVETGEKLREFFKKFVNGRKERVWFGQFMDKNVMVFRSGYFVIGKFPLAEVATQKLAEIVLSWMKSKGSYSYFDIELMSGSALGAWYGNFIVPVYHLTSSIAYFAGITPEVEKAWRKALSMAMARK